MSDIAQIDGRRQRADANRRRIAQAMIELVRAGEVAPSADEVAEHAGVGRRTVFRLFNDMDGVYREMHAVMVERLQPIFSAPFASRTWRERVDELIERRAKVFEDMLPVKTAAEAHRHRSAFLQKGHRTLTRLQREMLQSVLPANFAGERLEALDLTLSFEAWRRLRQEQRLPAKQAIAVWRYMLRAMLG